MAYNEVPFVYTADPWSAANHNEYVRDNFIALNSLILLNGCQFIAEVEVAGAAAADITFSSIPATFRHLRLILHGRCSYAGTGMFCRIQLNGDTGANYDWLNISTNDTSSNLDDDLADTSILAPAIVGNTAPANVGSGFEITFPNYRGTVFQKTTHAIGNYKNNTTSGNLYAAQSSGWWRNTNAITAIKLYPASGNFMIGTLASLYGMM